MHLWEFIHAYASDVITVLAGVSLVIEFTPIKINPWTWLFKQIGKRMNADLIKDVDSIKLEIKRQGKQIDENERDRIRYEILDFSNSLRARELHTKEEFDHILDQYDKYELIIAKLHQPNGKVTQAMKYINSVYMERQEKNDFIV